MANKEQKEKMSIEAATQLVESTVLEVKGAASLNETPPIHNGVFMANLFGNVEVDIWLNVYYGCNIPELSWEIQEKVKDALVTVAGIDPAHINIHIEGVDFSNVEENDEEN